MFNIIMIEELSYRTIDRRGIDVGKNNLSDRGRLYTNTISGQQGVNLRDVLNSGDEFVLIKVNGISRTHFYVKKGRLYLYTHMILI